MDIVVGDAEIALLEPQAIAAVVVDVVVVDGGVAAEEEDARVVAATDVVAIDDHAGRVFRIDTDIAAGNYVARHADARTGV